MWKILKLQVRDCLPMNRENVSGIKKNRWFTVHRSANPQGEQGESEKCIHSMDWLQESQWYSLTIEDIRLSKMNRISGKVIKFVKIAMKYWKVELSAGGKTLTVVKIQKSIFQGNALSPLLFAIAMMPLNYILKSTLGPTNLLNHKEKINHLMYMDDIKRLAKNEKRIGWLVVWVLWHINFCRLFNAKSIFIQIIISISNNSV